MLSYQIMAKPTGPICNLDCEYCYYLEKENLYKNSKSWILGDEELEAFIRGYIASQKTQTVAFAWQGGEPTLCGVEYFKKIVDLQKKYSDGRRIENALQTNGTLLNDSWGEFLAENQFLIGLSIDGPEEYHDHYRVDKRGQPTFKKVLHGLEILQKHAVDFNTLTVVSRRNSYDPLTIYRFLKEIGSQFIQFIPLVEQKADKPDPNGLILLKPYMDKTARVTDFSVEPLQYGIFLSTIFDEWVRNDVGKTFVQLFDVAMESWMGMQQGLCVFNKTCGGAMVMEHNGDVYSCDHFVYPEHRLGNILQQTIESMAESKAQHEFGQEKETTLPQYCRDCDVRFACNGECPKHRFLSTPSGERGLNYLCAGYKHFFTHIDPAMNFMAGQLRKGRAPAHVMQWIRAADAAAV
jgi:uncharacterized protein